MPGSMQNQHVRFPSDDDEDYPSLPYSNRVSDERRPWWQTGARGRRGRGRGHGGYGPTRGTGSRYSGGMSGALMFPGRNDIRRPDGPSGAARSSGGVNGNNGDEMSPGRNDIRRPDGPHGTARSSGGVNGNRGDEMTPGRNDIRRPDGSNGDARSPGGTRGVQSEVGHGTAKPLRGNNGDANGGAVTSPSRDNIRQPNPGPVGSPGGENGEGLVEKTSPGTQLNNNTSVPMNNRSTSSESDYY